MKVLPKNFLLSLSLPKNFNLITVFPRLKEEKTRSYATFVMTLAAISIFGFFAINPTLVTIVQLNKQLTDSRFVDQQFVEKIANLASLQTQYGKIQNDIAYVTKAIPTSPEIPTFLAQVQNVASTNNISLQRLQVLPLDITTIDPGPTSYFAFSFSIDATGNINSLNNFILGISNFDRLITVDNISIAQPPTGNISDATRLNIKGRAYFKKESL